MPWRFALIRVRMERLFLQRLKGQVLAQVLMTMGVALIFQDLALFIWGGDPSPFRCHPCGALHLGVVVFPAYRFFIIASACSVGIAFWLFLENTLAGATIRAAVDDGEMVQGVGINVPRVSMGVFALGAFLAALGGVIGGGFIGVYPGADFEILPYAFVVVIVEGIIDSLMVGGLDNFGKALFRELSYLTLFAPMVVILAVRPTGLSGKV